MRRPVSCPAAAMSGPTDPVNGADIPRSSKPARRPGTTNWAGGCGRRRPASPGLVRLCRMTPRSEMPRSRRARPAKPALTRAGIIATAVRLVRTEGLDRITMRRLAQELDTGPASLYVYLSNTAELHAAVFDEILGTVDLAPVDADGDWRERLIRVLTSYTKLIFE